MFNRRSFIIGGLAASAASTTALKALAAAAGAALPFKFFDSHIHLYTDDVAHYPYRGIERTKQRVLTMPNTAEKILKFIDENNVETAAAVQYRNAYVTDNSYVLDSSERFPKRFKPVVVVDPADPASDAILRDLVNRRHAVAIRLTGEREASGELPWLTSPAAAATIKLAGELGIFVELLYFPVNEPNATSLGVFAKVADQFPGVKFLVEHVGWTAGGAEANYGLSPAHVELSKRRNIVVKPTTLNFNMLKREPQAMAAYMRRVVDTFGEDRVIWGSDFGNSEGTYAELVALAVQSVAGLSDAQKRKVLRDNGMKLFKA